MSQEAWGPGSGVASGSVGPSAAAAIAGAVRSSSCWRRAMLVGASVLADGQTKDRPLTGAVRIARECIDFFVVL